jgi:hypothetical protein
MSVVEGASMLFGDCRLGHSSQIIAVILSIHRRCRHLVETTRRRSIERGFRHRARDFDNEGGQLKELCAEVETATSVGRPPLLSPRLLRPPSQAG